MAIRIPALEEDHPDENEMGWVLRICLLSMVAMLNEGAVVNSRSLRDRMKADYGDQMKPEWLVPYESHSGRGDKANTYMDVIITWALARWRKEGLITQATNPETGKVIKSAPIKINLADFEYDNFIKKPSQHKTMRSKKIAFTDNEELVGKSVEIGQMLRNFNNQDMSEYDTRSKIIDKIIERVFGVDMDTELSRDVSVNRLRLDYRIVADYKPVAFIEAKAAYKRIDVDVVIEQVRKYFVVDAAPVGIVTNGYHWTFYRYNEGRLKLFKWFDLRNNAHLNRFVNLDKTLLGV